MRHLKRTLNVNCSNVVTHSEDVDMMMSPEPERGQAMAPPMPTLSGQENGSPLLQPPPWKRPSLENPALVDSTPRLNMRGVSWSHIVSQSQDQDPHYQECSGGSGSSSPRTPRRPSCQPPSPHCRVPCRRRPPSDDGDNLGPDDNEGRLARDFCELTPIGKGQFSTVLRVRNKIDQCLYAVKKSAGITRASECNLQEVFALSSVGIEAEACRNIVRYFSSWLEDGRLHIQTELCECSLRDRLVQRHRTWASDPRFTEDGLVEVLRDVSSGLAVLHARNFVHLDIKPDNILVSRGSGGCYKIADLGLAAAAIGSGCDDISEGDCRYLAKEVLTGDLSDLPKADIFSLGMVAYELATNPKALPCNGDEWHLLRTGHLDISLLLPLPEQLLALLHRMVLPSATSRPSGQELCGHPSIALEDEMEALEEEIRQRTLEAERNRQLADEYYAELLSMKRQELLSGGVPPQPVAGGRPVASPAFPSDDIMGGLPGRFATRSNSK